MDFLILTKTDGFLGPFASALGFIMDLLFDFTSLFGIMNIGLCIILFTLVTKILMFPLTIKQQKSSRLMSVMQPEINAIQAKYKGKKDQDSMMKMNVETRAVYEKYGTSMTGGCLQLIIQMPILFALYRVIYNIPAYVGSVRVVFDQVVNGITSNYAGTYVEQLTEFASTNNIVVTGGLNNLATSSDKVIDFLYKLTPDQWQSLEAIFPKIDTIIQTSSTQIQSMNSFFGIDLATMPFSNGFVPTIAWLIPILAGLSQWYSTKLMTSTQTLSEDAPGAAMMKSMNLMMPLMSAFLCFSLPSGVGIYWIASSVFQIIQQWIVNYRMNRMDIDEMIRKNVEKANKKRAKKGLPPTKVTQNASSTVKKMQEQTQKMEQEREKKLIKTQENIKKSTEYYNQEEKPNSLMSKANMVKKYNEKQNLK